MKKIALMLLGIALFGVLVVEAQVKSISGTVTSSEDGMGIPGVSVSVKGTTIGTVTNLDGKYQMDVPADAETLIFSFVGMRTMEKAISGSVIDATLLSDVIGVDEVLVVAYGTKTKKALVGAITSVDSEVVENQISASPLRAIQGTAPGVNVLTTGGQPGENPVIRIRGIGSDVNAQPLIVVDGVTFSGNLNTISSDQIESINILKDASASALYGSRASNGVVLITTKGGRFGDRKTNVSVSARAGFSQPAVETYDFVGASDYMRYSWEAIKNYRIYGEGEDAATAAQFATDNLITEIGYNPFDNAKPIGTDGNVVSGANLLWDTDWYDALIRDKANYNEVTFSADGGSDNVSYFISGNRLDQKGAVIESDFERISGRVNLTIKLTDWLDFGTNNSFSRSTQNYPNQAGSSYTNGMQWVYTLSNIFPLYQRDANGALVKDEAGNNIFDFGDIAGRLNGSRILSGDNAVASTYNHEILYTRTNLLSTSYLKFTLTDFLSYTTKFGYEKYLFDDYQYTHYKYGHAASVGGRVSQERNFTETKTFVNALNFRETYGEHNVEVDAISEVFDLKYNELSADGIGFLPGVTVLGGSTTPEGVGGYIDSERLVSFLGRASYDFREKYYVDFSFRADASTRFKSGNRWGNFYSIGGSWIISDESFMDNASWLSLLKLRSSYGELGNNAGIGRFPYLASYDTGWNNNDNTGVLKGGYADEDIKWEKTQLFNVGVDYGFLNNRISGTIEYYNKESVDLLFEKPLAPSVGDSEYYTNVGIISNKGWEFQIQTINVNSNDLLWKTTFNVSANNNEIKELPQSDIINGSKKLRVGKGLFDFFIEDYAGVDPATGEALWYMDSGDIQVDPETGETILDSDGKPVYDNYEKITTNDYSQADRYYVGSSLPDFYGGFTSYLEYKGFDLNLLFNFAVGGKLLDYSYAGLMNTVSRYGDQLSTDIEGRWQNPGDETDIPKLYAGNNDYNSRSTRFLFDNNYLRLKALTLGYNLPSSIASKMKLSSLRLYLQADNILTFQSHKGIDPEQNIAGTTDDRSNMLKTYSLGIKIGL